MKILCRFHEDSVPSMELYEDGGHCFVCGAHVPNSELGLETTQEIKPKYVEDLKRKSAYIEKLPRKLIRGFELPYDELGFYIPYPNSLYYKLRLWEPPASGDKYRCPSGHPKEFFIPRKGESNKAIICEGELNALSFLGAFPDYDVICPGAASDFLSKRTESYLTRYCNYVSIIIAVDKDPAGTIAAINAKSSLLRICPNVSIVLMQRDANEILIHAGKEALIQEVKREMSRRL